MSEIVRVVVDAMGGDNAPGEIVKGAVAAANKHEDIHLIQQIMFTFQFHAEWTMPQRIEILTKEKV